MGCHTTLDGKVAPVHNIKGRLGVEVQLHLLFNHNASSASCSGSFTACIHCRGGWVVSIMGLDALEKKNPLPFQGWKNSSDVQPVA
jgi:hypothetical protein